MSTRRGGPFLQPSVRWWPTAASTYKAKDLMSVDGSIYRPARHDLVPFVNVNVGWTFGR